MAMRSLSGGLLASLALVLACAPAGASASTRPPPGVPPGLSETISTPHFVVHYTSAATSANATTAAGAQQLAANAERGYGLETSLLGRFRAPLDDGDGHTDIYVFSLPSPVRGLAAPDSPADQTSAWIAIAPAEVAAADLIDHELLHVLQDATYAPAATFLKEGTAAWAAARLDGISEYVPAFNSTGGLSLDCPAESCGSDLDGRGYTQWVFYEYLAERFGPDVVRQLFERSAISRTRDGVAALEATTAARGVPLSHVFTDYAIKLLGGGWRDLPALDDVKPQPDADTYLGARDRRLPARTLRVGHLAARYLAFTADGRGRACPGGELKVAVRGPAGIGVAAALADDDEHVHRAPSRGGVAHLRMPWRACRGAGTAVIPNPAPSGGDQTFVVSASVVFGPAVSISATRVGRGRRVLSVRLRSSRSGRLTVTVAGRRRSAPLRRGANHLRIPLGRPLSPGRRTVSLTTRSPSGVVGQRLRRRVRVRR